MLYITTGFTGPDPAVRERGRKCTEHSSICASRSPPAAATQNAFNIIINKITACIRRG